MGNFWERDPQKRWERDTRQWWQWLTIGVVITIVTPLLFAGDDWRLSTFYGPLAVLVSFQAGYFYNDRLRQLGKSRGLLPKLRRPPSEGDQGAQVTSSDN